MVADDKVNVSELSGKDLDYWVYRFAITTVEKKPSLTEFEEAYAKGKFRFTQDKALLCDLMEAYQIRLQLLSDEWLASSEGNSQYGSTPLVAACRWLVSHVFGASINRMHA